MSFRDWYYGDEKKVETTTEDVFYETVGVKVPSIKSFCSWLVLNKHMPPRIRLRENKKPQSFLDLHDEQKIYHMVKEVKEIKKLAEEFASKFDIK